MYYAAVSLQYSTVHIIINSQRIKYSPPPAGVPVHSIVRSHFQAVYKGARVPSGLKYSGNILPSSKFHRPPKHYCNLIGCIVIPSNVKVICDSGQRQCLKYYQVATCPGQRTHSSVDATNYLSQFLTPQINTCF